MNTVNGIRLQEFCQFKNEIRGSTEYLVVGLDIAKEKHNAFFGTATGTALYRGMFFDNSLEGFRKLFTQVEALKAEHGLSKVVFGLEPTANYHKPLAEHLIKYGHLVVLVSPASTVKNRELLDGRWDKHDTKDAANVADLVAQGKCMYYDYPEAAIRDIRSLLSFKKRLKKEEQALQVRIRNQLLAQYFPEMDRHFRTDVSLAVVRTCLDPSVISRMEYDEFCRTVAPGRLNLRQQRLLQRIWQLSYRILTYRRTKTKKPIPVPLNDRAMQIMTVLEKERSGHFVFKGVMSVKKAYSTASRKSGIKVCPHSLRHSFATHLLSKGHPIEHISKLLGHEAVSTTQIYADVMPEYLRDTVASLSPIRKSRGKISKTKRQHSWRASSKRVATKKASHDDRPITH